jgi:hypothetical protein
MLRGLPVAATAAVGVVVGHWVAYVLTVPRPQARARALMASGHGYWTFAVKGAVVLAFVSMGSALVRPLLDRLRAPDRRLETWTWVWARLAFLQVLGFAAMEIAERLVAHAPVGEMFDHHIFGVGLAVQVLVALAGALAITMLAGAVEGLVDAFARSAFPRPRSSTVPPARLFARVREVFAGAAGVRGPPPPLGT